MKSDTGGYQHTISIEKSNNKITIEIQNNKEPVIYLSSEFDEFKLDTKYYKEDFDTEKLKNIVKNIIKYKNEIKYVKRDIPQYPYYSTDLQNLLKEAQEKLKQNKAGRYDNQQHN